MALGYSYININPGDTITGMGFFKFNNNTNPTSVTFHNLDCNGLAFAPFSTTLIDSIESNKMVLDIYTSGSYFMGTYYLDMTTENISDDLTTYTIREYTVNSDSNVFNNPVYVMLRNQSTKGGTANGLLVTAPGSGPTGTYSNSCLTIIGTGPTGTNLDNYLQILGPTGTFLTSFDKEQIWVTPRVKSFNVSGTTTVAQAGSATLSALSLTSGSNDMAGSVSATLGGLGTGTIILTVTFGKAYTTTPQNVSVTAGNASSGSASFYVQNLSSTSFQVVVGAALLGIGTVYKFYYLVVA